MKYLNQSLFNGSWDYITSSIEAAGNVISNVNIADLLPSANFLSGSLVNVTKVLNIDNAPNLVDSYMDSVAGVGHRVKFGHSFDQLPDIVNKFGFEAIPDYFKHLGKDVMSPHGLPIPYANEITQYFNLSMSTANNWLCLNVGDLVFGGLSAYQSYKLANELLNASAVGAIPSSLVTKALMSSGVKLASLYFSPNPITLLSAISDIGFLSYAVSSELIESLLYTKEESKFVQYLLKPVAITGGIAGLTAYLLYSNNDNYSKKEKLEEVLKVIFAASIAGFFTVLAANFFPDPSVLAGVAISTYIVTKSVADRISIYNLKGYFENEFVSNFYATLLNLPAKKYVQL